MQWENIFHEIPKNLVPWSSGFVLLANRNNRKYLLLLNLKRIYLHKGGKSNFCLNSYKFSYLAKTDWVRYFVKKIDWDMKLRDYLTQICGQQIELFTNNNTFAD